VRVMRIVALAGIAAGCFRAVFAKSNAVAPLWDARLIEQSASLRFDIQVELVTHMVT